VVLRADAADGRLAPDDLLAEPLDPEDLLAPGDRLAAAEPLAAEDLLAPEDRLAPEDLLAPEDRLAPEDSLAGDERLLPDEPLPPEGLLARADLFGVEPAVRLPLARDVAAALGEPPPPLLDFVPVVF
jgi:hypothetical protein